MLLKNKKNPYVSVIVPAYNEEKHIEECLASIKIQTYSNIELIVIDDGSTDSTKRIAKKYADIFLIQKHQGPGTARNLGARKAKGEILVFIDADMYLDKDYVRNIIKPINEKKDIATFTKEEYIANPDNIWSKCFQVDNNLPLNRRLPKSYPDKDNKFRAILRKEFIKYGGYLENAGYGEDNILPGPLAIAATRAICYHYNPETLIDVFISARWMGRSTRISLNIQNFFKYSLINSLRNSILKIKKGMSKKFLIYKLLFDFAFLMGMFNKTNYSK